MIESGPQDFYDCQSIRPKATVSASRVGLSARVMFYLLAWFKCQLLTLVGVLPFSSLGSFSASLCRLTLSLPISFPNLYEPANSLPREYWSASDVLAPELSVPPIGILLRHLWEASPCRPLPPGVILAQIKVRRLCPKRNPTPLTKTT